ncbi:PIN domain protein, partial [Chlamydia psittaci 84-8471/1]
PWNRS